MPISYYLSCHDDNSRSYILPSTMCGYHSNLGTSIPLHDCHCVNAHYKMHATLEVVCFCHINSEWRGGVPHPRKKANNHMLCSEPFVSSHSKVVIKRSFGWVPGNSRSRYLFVRRCTKRFFFFKAIFLVEVHCTELQEWGNSRIRCTLAIARAMTYIHDIHCWRDFGAEVHGASLPRHRVDYSQHTAGVAVFGSTNVPQRVIFCELHSAVGLLKRRTIG